MAIHDQLESGLAKAVRAAGSQVAFGALIGKRQSTVQTWLATGKELPAEYVLPVEAALGISRHELRPDLYPLDDPAAPAQHPPARSPAAQHLAAPSSSAQRPAAHPSASASCPPEGQDADGSHPVLDYPGADPLKGLAA